MFVAHILHQAMITEISDDLVEPVPRDAALDLPVT